MLRLLLLLLFLPKLISAQEYVLDNWQVEDGLPNNSLSCITQTSDGYIWIGANGGLARFDGIKFTIFDIARTQVLRSNRILKLLEDSRKRLWIGSDGGGLCYYEKGKFKVFDFNYPGSAYFTIQGIKEVKGHGVFILTSQSGLFVIKPDGRILHFDKSKGLKTNTLTNVFQDEKGRIWVVDSRGISQYVNDSLADAAWNKLFKPDDHFWNIVYNKQQNAIFGIVTPHGSVDHFPFKIENDKLIPLDNLARKKLANFRFDKKGHMYFLSINGAFKANFHHAADISNILRPADAPSVTDVRDLYQDDEGNIWLATNAHGLFRIKNNPFSYIDYDESRINNSVLCLAKDTKENIWWTVPERGLFRQKEGKIQDLTPPNVLNIWTVYADGDTIYFSGYDRKLMYYANDKYHYIPFNTSDDQWVRAMTKYRNKLFVGSYENIFVLQNGQWAATPYSSLLKDFRINRFFIDSKENLWICGDKGVLKIDKTDKLISINEQVGKNLSHIRCAFELDNGHMLFGTYGNGMLYYDGKKITEINARNGLFDNTVSEILYIDEKLWAIGNLGLSRLSLEEILRLVKGKIKYVNCVLYDKSDGLKISEFNGGSQSSAVNLHDKVYAFPTINGLAVIDFSKIGFNTKPPKVVIEQIKADEKVLDITEAIKLPYDQNRIEINFAALSYISSKNNKYKYKLEGYDKSWIDAGTEQKAVYTHIPPGRYTFTVVASNNDGVWNTDGKSIDIEVIPPFYLTTWFSLVLFALIIMLLAGVVWIIIYNVKRRARNKQQLAFAEQQATIKAIFETEEAERKRIAKDLHDGIGPLLSTVKLNLALAMKSVKSELIQNSQSYIDNISTELRNITYNLMPTSLETFGLGVAVKEFLQKLSVNEEIEINFYEHGNLAQLDKNTQVLLFRSILEIVNNSIRHSKCSEINVQLIVHEDHLAVMIEDNGTGFNFDEAFSKTTSRGLKNIRDRISAMNGKMKIDSDKNHGTTFTLEVPLKKTADA